MIRHRDRCLSLCKDTNFKANHNKWIPFHFLTIDVCLCAKIRILKQITTKGVISLCLIRCLSLCKDTNFKANHNKVGSKRTCIVDVCLCAKVRILKQITTCNVFFEILIRCLSLCKDTNFKANHNKWLNIKIKVKDVCLCAKIRILKQITTLWKFSSKCIQMFVFVQRYEF